MKRVTTIGLGYIGLPTSALMASKGIQVHGVDINQEVVDTINRGKIHIVEPDLDIAVKSAVKNGCFSADTSPKNADVYLIVVPTPFKGDHQPDISYVQNATKSIIPLLKEDDLYIIESTSPVGTTEKMRDLIFAERPELKNKINMAYCPERVLPGNVMYELVNNDRVIGGLTQKCTDKAIEFYSQFVIGEMHRTNAKTAEMCKLIENSSRDVQIAFANELSIICDKAGINVWELINLANKHPRVNILQPGCGVGGHCIAVDPYFIISEYPEESQIISKAREINNFKTQWCIEKIKNKILSYQINNKRKPIVGIYGLTFKPNIDDTRESPALDIALQIEKFHGNEHTIFVEPNLKASFHESIKSIEYAEINCDLQFILVQHVEFESLDLLQEKIESFVQ